MTTMTHAAAPFAETKHHPLSTVALVLLFWMIAALLIVGTHRIVDPISSNAGVVLKLGAIVASGFAYMRLTARKATVDHALFVGLAWLLLDIISEIVASQAVGSGWFVLIGAPTSHVRDLMLFTWVVSPAIYARYE